jgi:hypothetical protein
VLARLRGEAPTDGHVDDAPTVHLPPPPPKPKKAKKPGGGPNAIVVAAAAFAVGVLVAKFVDWRGHAHPRF